MTEEDELAAELEALHAGNVQRHGAALADLARWTAYLRLCEYLMRCEGRRREKALEDALAAQERAKAAEVGQLRWLGVARWVARRVDASARRLARRSRVVTTINFGAKPAPSSPPPADDQDGEIPW